MLAPARFVYIAHDLAAHVVYGVRVFRHQHHKGLLPAVGKTALADKAQADLVPLIDPPALNEAVHQRALLYHAGNAQNKAVEKRGFVLGMLRVFLFQKFDQLSGVNGVVDVDLAVRAVGHQVCHNGLQAGGLSHPSPVAPVSPAPFLLTHCKPSPLSLSGSR